MLVQGLAGCGDSRSPTAPPQGPPRLPPAPTLKVFTDSAGFSTSDLRDVQDQIVQFNSANELIWAADGTRLQGFKVERHDFGNGPFYLVSIPGSTCPRTCAFEVRFGTKNGEKRAYLTVDYIHDNAGTLVDVEIVGGALVVTQTDIFPPGTPTLSGIVAELTPTGPVPVAGVNVYRGVTTGWRGATTDRNGFYSIQGLIDCTDTVSVSKEGYETRSQALTMNGDTRFDIHLVRTQGTANDQRQDGCNRRVNARDVGVR